DRRLRLGDRRGARRLHHRNGVRRGDLRRLGQLLGLRVPGRDPVPGRGRQHLDLPTGTEGAAMSEGASNVNETTAGAADEAGKAPKVEPNVNGGVPALEVRSVSKYFGSVNALEDISLAVYAGQVTCVLGDNGAGKST